MKLFQIYSCQNRFYEIFRINSKRIQDLSFDLTDYTDFTDSTDITNPATEVSDQWQPSQLK